MTSWRKLVLDIMEGRVPETGPTVREAVCDCQHGSPVQRSGSFTETVNEMALAEAKRKTAKKG